MARRFAFIALVAMLFTPGGCQSNGGNSQGPDAAGRSDDAVDVKREISDLLDQYTQALLKKDVAALDRIWADDLTFVNLHGELLSKQQRMDNIKTGATAFKSIKLTEVRVRPYGQAAVATCRVAIEGQYSGQEGSGDYRVTTVWARPKEARQMVAVQMTKIGQ
jgi:ketosteroid isomerase-like protein